MMSEIVIRSAEENDREDILGMLQKLQNYEHSLHVGRRPGDEVDEYQYVRLSESAKHSMVHFWLQWKKKNSSD